MQEHLDEAAFFWRQRERALREPDHELADLADGDERRLLAHVDGLCAGGLPVARRLLIPALAEGEGFVRTAAAYALLTMDASQWGELVMNTLREAPAEERPALGRALALSQAPEVVPLLLTSIPKVEEPGLLVTVLDILRARQADLTRLLELLPLEGAPEVLAAAIRAARHAPTNVTATLVARGLASTDARCQDASVEVGLAQGHFGAAETCRRWLTQGRAGRTALAATAMSGDRRGVTRLLAEVEAPQRRAEALWALGLSGRSEALEAVLRLAVTEADPLAAESFRLMTGIPLDTYLAPADEEEAEEASSSPCEEISFLPGPTVPTGRVRPEALQRWWSAEQSRFPPGGRYLWGRRWTPERALDALSEVPVTRRPALAWELAVRSGGTIRVETSTWAWVQLRQLHAARSLRVDPGPRTFEAMLGAT